MNDQAYHWTTERQIHYPMVTEVALSPDGRQVAYAIREPFLGDEKSEFITHLYLAPIEGGEPIQLTYGEHSNRVARWSPDGRYIAFLSTRSGKANLYAVRVAGGKAWTLTQHNKKNIVTFEWSPDGQSLAFLMAEPPSEEKEKARKAKDDPILWDVDFDFCHLFRVPFAVGPRELPPVTQLTRGRVHILGFDWLPDGEAMALVHRPTPVDDDWPNTRLGIVPADPEVEGTPYGPENLTDIALLAEWTDKPWVSPDGKWIACTAGDQPPRWGLANRVVLYPVAGGEPRSLARTADERCWLLGWASDGTRLYAIESSGVNSQIWALPISAEPSHLLTDTPSYKGPLDVNPRDQVAFVDQDLDRPNAICVLDARTGCCRQVVVPPLPSGWTDLPLPKTEVIRWPVPGGADVSGTSEIEGIVILPLGYQPGRQYPLVVEVHGGPMGVFSRRYLATSDSYCDAAALAERGFVVLRANPRGSSGYGKSFRFANYGDWGGGDYQDIMAGIDFLLERGMVDPERMGIMGWSYGGYMTSWVITQTDRFKAACVGAGVTNLMSFGGTADIPSFIPDYLGTESWDDPEPYLRHSAMFQVKGVTTPTLIQHGQADTRVPVSQGRELYNALKRQGVSVEMVIYPRQGHSIDEPRLRIDLRQRAVDWLVRWILDK